MIEEKIGKFELFKGAKKTYAPKVSIRKNAQIAISTGAVRQYGFRDDKGSINYKHFLLYYNSGENMIGIKPTEEPKDGAIKARDHSSGEIQLACQSFLDRYGIPYNKTRRYPMEYDDSLDIYIVDLKENWGHGYKFKYNGWPKKLIFI